MQRAVQLGVHIFGKWLTPNTEKGLCGTWALRSGTRLIPLFMTAPSSHLKNSTEMYLSLPMMTDSMGCLNTSSLCQLYTISSYLYPTSISNCTFPFEHIPSSHSHLYSILLTLLYILPLTQLGCVCLPRLIVLFVYL